MKTTLGIEQEEDLREILGTDAKSLRFEAYSAMGKCAYHVTWCFRGDKSQEVACYGSSEEEAIQEAIAFAKILY